MKVSSLLAAVSITLAIGAPEAGAAVVSYSYVGSPMVCDSSLYSCPFEGAVLGGGFQVDTDFFSSGGLRGASFSFESFMPGSGYTVTLVARNGDERIERTLENRNWLDLETDGLSVSGMFAEFLFGNVMTGRASFSLDDAAMMASSSGTGMLGGSNDYWHATDTESVHNGSTGGGGVWTRSPAVIPLPPAIATLAAALGALGFVGARRASRA
ncbi:MAG: hypothetical protein ACK5MQ_01030 [Pikeienuella sp.]